MATVLQQAYGSVIIFSQILLAGCVYLFFSLRKRLSRQVRASTCKPAQDNSVRDVYTRSNKADDCNVHGWRSKRSRPGLVHAAMAIRPITCPVVPEKKTNPEFLAVPWGGCLNGGVGL